MKDISINIITTNDEPYLDKTLSSVRNLDPEYVIVFNGNINSEEYETCKKYTKNVYVRQWNNDFSELRNFAKEKSTRKWILWLDSDEELEDCSKIIEINPKNDFHNFKLIHGSTTMSQLRLFKNLPEYKWQGRIHERIIPKNLPEWHPEIKIIHHPNNISRSQIRNLNILKEEIENDPNNPDLNFFIAIEYHLVNQQMKSLLHAEKFLFHYHVNDIRKMYIRYLISWIYTFHLRNYQKAIQIIFGQLAQNCNIAEFWCLLGDIYYKLGKFNDAKKFYENAIIMGKYKYDNMWITDLDKYQKYPKLRIDYCIKKQGIDLKKEILQNEKILIP